jgi:hypothetical protein
VVDDLVMTLTTGSHRTGRRLLKLARGIERHGMPTIAGRCRAPREKFQRPLEPQLLPRELSATSQRMHGQQDEQGPTAGVLRRTGTAAWASV